MIPVLEITIDFIERETGGPANTHATVTARAVTVAWEHGQSASLRSLLPLDDSDFAYGLNRCLSRGNRTASRMFSSPSIVITRRSTPYAQPACGGIPYLNISV